MATRIAVVSVGLVFALSACGGSSSKPAGPETSTKASTTTTGAALACEPQRVDCTSEQVIATVAYLYEKGGATPAEAACLAPITATGKTAVNQAFEAPTAAQTEDAIACVGSETRLRTIASDSAAYMSSHPNG
jgi:hypothetical protein